MKTGLKNSTKVADFKKVDKSECLNNSSSESDKILKETFHAIFEEAKQLKALDKAIDYTRGGQKEIRIKVHNSLKKYFDLMNEYIQCHVILFDTKDDKKLQDDMIASFIDMLKAYQHTVTKEYFQKMINSYSPLISDKFQEIN